MTDDELLELAQQWAVANDYEEPRDLLGLLRAACNRQQEELCLDLERMADATDQVGGIGDTLRNAAAAIRAGGSGEER